MGADHGHGAARDGRIWRLWAALSLIAVFLCGEVVASILTGSLALLSDAAHMFADGAAIALSLAAIRIAKLPADRRRSFGYHRFEILAATLNASVLALLSIYIIFEGTTRLLKPAAAGLDAATMLAVGIGSVAVNLAALCLLASGAKDSLNVKSAYFEVMGDLINAAGIVLAACAILFLGWLWADAALAVVAGLLILPRTWALLKESINVLLEAAPPEIALEAVEAFLTEIPGVAAIHELHVWTLTTGKNSLTAHLALSADAVPDTILAEATRGLADRFRLTHTTLQLDTTACDRVEHR